MRILRGADREAVENYRYIVLQRWTSVRVNKGHREVPVWVLRHPVSKNGFGCLRFGEEEELEAMMLPNQPVPYKASTAAMLKKYKFPAARLARQDFNKRALKMGVQLGQRYEDDLVSGVAAPCMPDKLQVQAAVRTAGDWCDWLDKVAPNEAVYRKGKAKTSVWQYGWQKDSMDRAKGGEAKLKAMVQLMEEHLEQAGEGNNLRRHQKVQNDHWRALDPESNAQRVSNAVLGSMNSVHRVWEKVPDERVGEFVLKMGGKQAAGAWAELQAQVPHRVACWMVKGKVSLGAEWPTHASTALRGIASLVWARALTELTPLHGPNGNARPTWWIQWAIRLRAAVNEAVAESGIAQRMRI
uniref:RdRp n=1 Tax=viral metagenome TaxID=1070528 RepID=A0A2V0R9I3_9ZZZZ